MRHMLQKVIPYINYVIITLKMFQLAKEMSRRQSVCESLKHDSL
jgi:hypothetical protein